MNIGIFYGSTMGTTEEVAHKIARALEVNVTAVHGASEMNKELIDKYDVLIMGTSTWNMGEIQDDWYDGIKLLKKEDLSHKAVALFGCGDSDGYADTFCDGMGFLYEEIKDTGCKFIGSVDTDGYDFDSSIAVVDGKFVGLAIDEENESEKTEDRVSQWVDQIKKEYINA